MSKRPMHPNGVDRLYPDCQGNYPEWAVWEEECPAETKCPAQPFELYTPISVAECDAVPPVKIPHVSVKNRAEARAFPNHYVNVEATGEVLHIDEYGNAVSLSKTPIFKNNFKPEDYVGIYQGAQVIDFAAERIYFYNMAGQYGYITMTVPMLKVDEENL